LKNAIFQPEPASEPNFGTPLTSGTLTYNSLFSVKGLSYFVSLGGTDYLSVVSVRLCDCGITVGQCE